MWVGASSRELSCIPAAYKLLTEAKKINNRIQDWYWSIHSVWITTSGISGSFSSPDSWRWPLILQGRKKSALRKSRSDYYPINIQQGTFSPQVRPIHVRSQGQCRSRKWGSARIQKVCCVFFKQISFDHLSLFQITLQSGTETKQLWTKRIKHDSEWNPFLWKLPSSLKWGQEE